MKTAVRAACVLAAVFFAGVSNAALTFAYFGTQSEAQSACQAKRAEFGLSPGCASTTGCRSDGKPAAWSSCVGYAFDYPNSASGWFFYFPPSGFSCPAGQEMDVATGECVVPPADACAAKSGQPGPTLRGNFDGFENDSYVDADGCDVAPVGSVQCAIPYTEASAGKDYFPPVCWIESEYTGTYSPPTETPPTQLTAPEPPQATEDSRESTSSTPPSTTTTTTNADGSVTTTTTTTTTTTEAAGTVVTNGTTKTVVAEQEAGRTTVTTTQVETTTQPDGTVVKKETTTKQVTVGEKKTTTLTPTATKVSSDTNVSPSQTDSGRTTKTTTTNPDGSSSTTTSTEGGGGQGAEGVGAGFGDGEGDETQSGTCGLGTPDSPPCKIDEEGTPEFDAAELPDPTQALQDHVATLEALSGEEAGTAESTADIRSAVEGSLPASGDCGPMTVSFGPTSLLIDGQAKFAFIRDALSWVFGLLSAFAIFGVITRP